jgi:hypothetical protein
LESWTLFFFIIENEYKNDEICVFTKKGKYDNLDINNMQCAINPVLKDCTSRDRKAKWLYGEQLRDISMGSKREEALVMRVNTLSAYCKGYKDESMRNQAEIQRLIRYIKEIQQPHLRVQES